MKSLPKDQRPWVDIAKRVLAGEFKEPTRSMKESLHIGLRGINHPLCRKANAMIMPNE